MQRAQAWQPVTPYLQGAIRSALAPYRDRPALSFSTVGSPGYIELVTCNDSYLLLVYLDRVYVYGLQTGDLLHDWPVVDLTGTTDVDQFLISTTNRMYAVCIEKVKPAGTTHTVRVLALDGQLLWSHAFDTLLQGPTALWGDQLLLVKDNALWSLAEGQGCVHVCKLPWLIPSFSVMRLWCKPSQPEVMIATGDMLCFLGLNGPPTKCAIPLDACNVVVMGDRLYWRERYTSCLRSVRLHASAYVSDYLVAWGKHHCLIGVGIRNGRRHLVTHARDQGLCQLFE